MVLNEIEKKINISEDLRELRQIQQFIKDRKRTLGSRLKYSLVIGDKVTVNNGRTSDKGTVTKINRTRAVVDMRGSSWNVPFSMITKGKNENK